MGLVDCYGVTFTFTFVILIVTCRALCHSSCKLQMFLSIKKTITCIFDILFEHGCDEGVTILVLYTRGTGYIPDPQTISQQVLLSVPAKLEGGTAN